MQRDFTIWADNWNEANYAADKLDESMDRHGRGPNMFHIAIIPDRGREAIRCPFDTCYLTDKGAREMQRQFVVV